MPRKPNSECQIMVFRPSVEEFSDFSRYIQYMESQGAHRGGVAKIIPPKDWVPCCGYDDIDNLCIPAPISQVVTGQKGLYTQYNIQQKPMTVKEMRRLTNTDKYASPFHESYEDLERTYWKNITFNPAIYGADISGSLYSKDVNVWNVARLNTILDLIENDTGVKIEGVNTAYLYFGMWKTSFAWHTEDMDLYSINYVHFGAPKTWYAVPPEHGKRLERLASGFFPNSNATCPAFLRHKMTLISPSVLRQYGIPFNKITQEAGEFMVTFPYGYHSGFNHGFNCAESTNFASERWINYGLAAEKCRCRTDMVYINMDLFVKSFQPEKYEKWKTKKYDVKLCYTDIPDVPDFSKKPVHWRERMRQIKKEHAASEKAMKLSNSPTKQQTPDKTSAKSPVKTQHPTTVNLLRTQLASRPKGISKMTFAKPEKKAIPFSLFSQQRFDELSKMSHKRNWKRDSSCMFTDKNISTSHVKSKGDGSFATEDTATSCQLEMNVTHPAESSRSRDVEQIDDPEREAHYSTLFDRIKMKRRKAHEKPTTSNQNQDNHSFHLSVSANPCQMLQKFQALALPLHTDHDMYTKPHIRHDLLKINPMSTHSPTQNVSPDSQISSSETSRVKNETEVREVPKMMSTINESGSDNSHNDHGTSITGTKNVVQSFGNDTLAEGKKNSSKLTKLKSSPLSDRPPLKRRHPVSKKGPSKKSSPTVVIKNTSADSESSDDEPDKKSGKKHRRFSNKRRSYIENEGYPSLWPRRKTTFRNERQYNATVAKLPPHCAICTLFRPYYKRSTSTQTAPSLSSLLEKTPSIRPGTSTEPLIPEINFATSIDNPAPLATCSLLDNEGKSVLIQCRTCMVQVHASCYGVGKVPQPDEGWNCDRCSFKAWVAQCSLCCMRGGALKPVNDGLQWAHVLCAVAIPEVSFDDIPARNGVNIKNLGVTRQKLKCTYCRRKNSHHLKSTGSCIQCCAGTCAVSFHPTCAHAAGVRMETGDWPLPVYVYCHRHALQKERRMEMDVNKVLSEVTTGQMVYGKHRNGRYYPCRITSESSLDFHHVVFEDCSWSDNLYQQDIVSHDFEKAPPNSGDKVQVKWTDGKLYNAEYKQCRKHQILMVEFEDGSFLSNKREDVYTSLDEMPKRTRRKLSTATSMANLDHLQSPQKITTESFVRQRATHNEQRKKLASKTRHNESNTSEQDPR